MKGKLIVFEGTDGSGKTTQVQLLSQRLTRESVDFRIIDFPRYGNPFAEPAKLYLEGALGKKAGDVNAYAASVLFAVDRFASYREDWGKDYEAGKLILANRYTTSNAVHQASKLPPEEQKPFVDWLFDLEYGRLGLPKPSLVVYLDVPTELTERLMRQREEKTGTHADIHERDESYLRSCRSSAREIASACGWSVVDCAAGGRMRTAEEIHEEVYGLVRSYL